MSRILNLATSVDAANGAPTIDDATLGQARPFAMDQAIVCVRSTAGSDAMTVGVKIWGYQTELDQWYDLGELNEGSDIAESDTDIISYAEPIAGLRAFDRFYAEVVAIGGTATAVSIDMVCVRSGPVTVS